MLYHIQQKCLTVYVTLTCDVWILCTFVCMMSYLYISRRCFIPAFPNLSLKVSYFSATWTEYKAWCMAQNRQIDIIYVVLHILSIYISRLLLNFIICNHHLKFHVIATHYKRHTLVKKAKWLKCILIMVYSFLKLRKKWDKSYLIHTFITHKQVTLESCSIYSIFFTYMCNHEPKYPFINLTLHHRNTR